MPKLSPDKLPPECLEGIRLSRNFTLDECLYSETATRLEIDNRPALEHVIALSATVNVIVQPVREELGAPITVSSGYRCAELCMRIGSTAGSRHTRGQALDLKVKTPQLYGKLVMLLDEMPFDGLIIERSGNSRWIHVSYNCLAASRGVRRRYDGSTYHPLPNDLHGTALAAQVVKWMT